MTTQTVTEIIRGKQVHVGWSINTHIHLLSVSKEPRSSSTPGERTSIHRVSKYHSPLKGKAHLENLLIPGQGQGKFKVNLGPLVLQTKEVLRS